MDKKEPDIRAIAQSWCIKNKILVYAVPINNTTTNHLLLEKKYTTAKEVKPKRINGGKWLRSCTLLITKKRMIN